MTRQEILDRLEDPAPMTQTELGEMIHYTLPTIRKLIAQDDIQTVGIAGLRNRRIPISEVRRILAELRMLQDPVEKVALTEKMGRTPLRAVSA
jgi:hypothetical protein